MSKFRRICRVHTYKYNVRLLLVSCLLFIFGVSYAAPVYYNPWDRVHVASAEQACLRTIDFFKNNPPNTYIDWSFVRSEFGQDFDSRVIGANGDYFAGSCIMTHTNPQVGTGIFYMPFSVECLAGHIIVKKDSNTATCTSQGLNLTLISAPNQTPPDPRPKGTEGKDPKSSTHELIAKVMEGSTPKAGVTVSFKSHVIPLSGGHEHEGNRPEATVAPINGVTDANGQVRFKFTATEFAGEHVVTAACDSCSNKTADEVVTALVPNLVELGADYLSPARYILIGDTPKHPSNHFFTSEAKDALYRMLELFKNADWGVVGVNDASLKWGGRFDIAGAWNGSHHEHLEGKEVDLSFVRPTGITEKVRNKVYNDANEAEGVSIPQILWHLKDSPTTGSKAHFHVYLLGQKASRTTPF